MNKFKLTMASLAPLLAIASMSVDAEAARRSRAAPQADADDYREYRQGNGDRRRYNSYTDRANDRDPAGDYKGYPDWARAALGSGGNTRGSR